MNSHTDDENEAAVSLTAKARASDFAALRPDKSAFAALPPSLRYGETNRWGKGRLRCVTAVFGLAFVVPALAQDASPFRDLDRYAFGYAYPGSQLKDHIYERSRRF